MITIKNTQLILLDGLKSFRESAESLTGDFLKLVKALGLWAVPFVLSIVAIAVLPAIFATHIGKLTDAINGARGVGTMTIDVTRAIRVLTGATIVAFLAEMFLSRFEGKAGMLAQTAYSLGALVVLALMLLNLGWYGVAIWPIVLLVIRTILKKVPYLQYVFVVPVVLLFLHCATSVIEYATIRAITVGGAMTTVVVAGMYAVVTAGVMLKRDNRS
ncbi:MAG: hypothetical protein WC802_01480 [Patescibacteria group bacterium]|jgi:hypothetical protein